MARVPGPPGGRIAVVVVIAIVAALCIEVNFSGGSASSSAAADEPPRMDQSRLILRLTDLPPGYVRGYDGEESHSDGLYCRAFTHSQDEMPALEPLVQTHRPSGCIAFYEKAFSLPGEQARAPLVFSGVIALDSDAAAEAAWKLVPTLFRATTKSERAPTRAPAPVKVGATTRFFRSSAVPYPYSAAGRKASFLAWRSGNTVAAVVAVAKSYAESDATVAELAPRQQEHVRNPTRYTGAERFDGEVPLDDPAIEIPVYWLGRSFRPGGGVPKSALLRASFSGEPRPEREIEGIDGTYPLGPEAPLQIDYEAISLDTWPTADWPVFAGSETARAITSWKCTKARTVALPEGTATIYSGFKEDFARCPKMPPTAFTAWVQIGGVTVVVNPFEPLYGKLEDRPYAAYNSFKGMEAVVRGLKLRPPPVY